MTTSKMLILFSVILFVTLPGCTAARGVALRPDGTPGPEECSEEAQKAMKYLRLHVGDEALAELDANQVGARPMTLYDGPVESVLDEGLGLFEETTRLYGKVWTGGPQVVIRYYEADPPDGDKVPICAVARLGNGQLRKRPESKPGTAILDFSIASVAIVDAFR